MHHTERNCSLIVVEIAEMFQEFLKYASVDGIIDSWCLEVTLKKNVKENSKLYNVEDTNQMMGLHSLSHSILKKLEERHHEKLSDSCDCGWNVSHIPKFHHSDINRYTPGTVIRWSMGECHVLLAPSPFVSKPCCSELGDSSNDVENRQTSDQKAFETSEVKMISKEIPPRLGVIQNVNSTICEANVNQEVDSNICTNSHSEASKDSRYFIKYQHFCDENVKCSKYENKYVEETTEEPRLSPRTRDMDSDVSDSAPNIASDDDDEENSCMLIINEDENSQDPKDSKSSYKDVGSPDSGGGGNGSNDSAKQDYSFKQVLPLTTSNVVAFAGGKEDSDVNNFPTKDSGDDDSNSVSSSSVSSSSSSSSSTSSSSTSSDDDRINFEKRVEEAAQAAKEAAATSAISTASSFEERTSSPSTIENEEDQQLPSSSSKFLASLSFESSRNSDDIQAAQGLAALGKRDAFDADVEVKSAVNESLLRSTTSKIAHKLLQSKNVNVKKLGPNTFQCGVCSGVFNRLTKALEHQISHTGEKPWECDICNKKYSKYHSLQKHHRVQHMSPQLQQFSCCICDKKFAVQSALKRHLDTHKNIKPFPCNVCSRTFALKVTRDTHEALHSGNRPWICNVCCKAFISKYKLNAHMKGHTGELFCQICNRTFNSQDIFTRHKKKHDITYKSTGQASSILPSLPKDKKIAGEKLDEVAHESSPVSAFRCQMCNKKFQNCSDLTLHLTSCNAINYCPSTSIQPSLPEGTLLPSFSNSEIQPLIIQPQSEAHHQHLIPFLSEEEKKLPQNTLCSSDNNLTQGVEGLNRKSFIAQDMNQMTSYQHQNDIIHSNVNSVSEGITDYLNNVAFETTAGNSSIAFHSSHSID